MKEKKFQLCFALPDCPSPTFLIPGLLPKDEPDETGLDGDTLEFQYHYRILPEGVLSRFIVLSHEKIHQQICWRSGVMLAYAEGDERYNLARVKADPEEDKVFISINGRETTRRIFLSLIRDTFTKIHRSFANLEVTEWVPVPDYPEHPPLDYQELLGLEAMGERDYPIGKLRIRVDLRQLLDGYESLAARQRQRQQASTGVDEFSSQGPSREINISIVNQQQQGDYHPMSETNFHNQGANIANQVGEAKDNAQVTATNFTQTSGVSGAELLALVASMRQAVAQLPTETQEDLIIEVEDIEAEVKKPTEQRNLPKLKKRLLALATGASVAATGISGGLTIANEIVDQVTELGDKVGIELQLPPSP
jgi:internalin A